MYDLSFNELTLRTLLRKGDFRGVPAAAADAYRDKVVADALAAARTSFGGANPLRRFRVGKRDAFAAVGLANDLVIRKLTSNLRRELKHHAIGRDPAVRNLCHFLTEGVPYRVYRLDVKNFYESFTKDEVARRIDSTHSLSFQGRELVSAVLTHHSASGGRGLPTGMSLSAVLSELMMASFDIAMTSLPEVYFYCRYVDDIVILTNLNEDEQDLLAYATSKLPPGLDFNDEKQEIISVEARVRARVAGEVPHGFEYLGYAFTIANPSSGGRDARRELHVEMAPAKINRTKLRIVRALHDFSATGDITLLTERFRYLTSNFSVHDRNTGKKKIAGIYYSYPQLSSGAESLRSLDNFLRFALMSASGRVFAAAHAALPKAVRRDLLRCSFQRGHAERVFAHFSAAKIADIQRCWLHG